MEWSHIRGPLQAMILEYIIFSPNLTTGHIPAYTQPMSSFSDLPGPWRFHPYHMSNMPHIDGWKNPISNTGLGKEFFFIYKIISLWSELCGKVDK